MLRLRELRVLHCVVCSERQRGCGKIGLLDDCIMVARDIHRLLNLPDVTGNVQDHHDLDNALAQGGTHPCLHKLARRAQPHPSVATLVDGKFKRVCTRMTRDELSQHC